MKASARFLVGILLSAVLTSPALSKDRPNYDASASSDPARRVPFAPRPEDRSLIHPGRPVETEDRFGVPTFVWAPIPSSGLDSAGAPHLVRPERAARQHLGRYAALYHLDEIGRAHV